MISKHILNASTFVDLQVGHVKSNNYICCVQRFLHLRFMNFEYKLLEWVVFALFFLF